MKRLLRWVLRPQRQRHQADGAAGGDAEEQGDHAAVPVIRA